MDGPAIRDGLTPPAESVPRGRAAHGVDTGGARVFVLPEAVSRAIGVAAIRTVFQPIIDLETASIIGFEALTRGPAGSVLEDPLKLLQAARRCGFIGELDWACRAAAARAVLDSGLPAGLTWFVNVEPDALATSCPKYLFSTFRRAASRLRLVLEVVERGCENHQAELLELAVIARRNGWGIALDDVGVNDASLALLPVLQPDVVKLDASLLDPDNGAAAMVVITALHTHARTHRMPHLIVEGIETASQLASARSMFGARYGQGFRFGRPQPLPRNVIPPTQPLNLLPAPVP